MSNRIFLTIMFSVTHFNFVKAIYPSLYDLAQGEIITREYILTYSIFAPRSKSSTNNLAFNNLVWAMERIRITEQIQRHESKNKLKITYSSDSIGKGRSAIVKFITDLFQKIDLHVGFNILLQDLSENSRYRFITESTDTIVDCTKKNLTFTAPLIFFKRRYETLIEGFGINEYGEGECPTEIKIERVNVEALISQNLSLQQPQTPGETVAGEESEESNAQNASVLQETTLTHLVDQNKSILQETATLPNFLAKGSPITLEIYQSMLTLVEQEKENICAPLNKLSYSQRVDMLIKYLQGEVRATLCDEYKVLKSQISDIIKLTFDILIKDMKIKDTLCTISQYKCKIFQKKK